MTDDREERSRRARHHEPPDGEPFPIALRRCTCGTPSYRRDDHANTCPLGPTPARSTTPGPTTATRLVEDGG
ncbi:hypothetical protein [Mycobacterium szulgai]|uniref:hypothetical protein n=1 Tax=Mycobacterium szulgai TaxID=1787 RepID=UPI00111BF038|nr:hypothetical protein [Mycobacterium szulgai]MCV7076979.1 hypothetical protein [Mycobacterium szulgai]